MSQSVSSDWEIRNLLTENEQRRRPPVGQYFDWYYWLDDEETNEETNEEQPSSTPTIITTNDTIQTTVGPGSRDTQCPICRLEIAPDAPTMTHNICGTVFCDRCLGAWIEMAAPTNGIRIGMALSCPMCRGTISKGLEDLEAEIDHDIDPEIVLMWFNRKQLVFEIRLRTIIINRISQELQRANGDIAGVSPYKWIAMIEQDHEIQRRQEDMYAFNLLRILHVDGFRDDVDQIRYDECEVPSLWEDESHAAFPVLNFHPLSMEPLSGFHEVITPSSHRHPPPPSSMFEEQDSPPPHFDPATLPGQLPVRMASSIPRLDLAGSLGAVNLPLMQYKFWELEQVINKLRDHFSHSRRDVQKIPQELFYQSYVLHQQVEELLRRDVPNFLEMVKIFGEPVCECGRMVEGVD